MMGTQNTAVESRSGLAGLFGAQGALASGDFAADGEFAEALQGQLGGLLAELGVDPKSLEGMDINAMLAQLQALLKGQLDAAGGEGLPLDADALQALGSDALDLLQEGGESSGTAISLSALKLFLQANGEQEGGSEEDLEAQAALAALLQQWTGQSNAVPGDSLHESPQGDLLAQLQKFLSNGQNKEVDDAPKELLSQLRQLLSNGQIKEVDDVPKELLAQLRQLLSSGQFADADVDGAQADMLAQLRRLLTQGPMGDAGGAESRRQVFDLLSQAFSERSGDVSGADSLALLKASLTANTRGSEQTNAAAEGAKAFDLARLLTPDGARQFADRLAMIAQARAGMAELKLHPPSLGSMEVRVSMDADRAHVHFVSANPAVRDLLEAALPRLREALAQDGISLGDASVSDQPPQRRDEASGEGAAAGDGEGGGDTDGETLLAAEGPVASSTLSALARKLDLFA